MDKTGAKCFAAIQKGRGGMWIIRFIDSPQITWKETE